MLRRLRASVHRLLAITRGEQTDVDFADELASHLQLHIDDNLRAGMAPDEARRQAVLKLGGIEPVKERVRDTRGFQWLDALRRDASYAVRMLRREPLFALVAIATLAIGITLTTTVFSVVDAELWKPLPYPDAGRLVDVHVRQPEARGGYDTLSGADFDDWQAQSRSFERLAAEGSTERGTLRRESSRSVLVTSVTSNYFATLGARFATGRDFTSSDAVGRGAVILTDHAWHNLFGADPSVVGRSVVLDGRAVVIVGVLDDGQSLLPDEDMFQVIDPASADFCDRNARAVRGVIGRLHVGVSASTAQAELQTIAARIAKTYPDGRAGRRVEVRDLWSDYAGFNWRPLYFFLAGSILVLLLTSANVANLLVARALRRRPEFAIRGALGGGIRVLARQLTVEGALLALPAAALGLLLTGWTLSLLATRIPPDYLERGTRIPLDARACAFAIIVTALTSIVFGLVPAIIARRTDLHAMLTSGGHLAGKGPGQARTQFVLLVGQIGLTVVLLAGAGLFVRSYVRLTQAPLGFDPHDRATVRVALSGARFGTDAEIRRYASRVLDGARAMPGIEHAAIDSSAPLESGPLMRLVARSTEGGSAEPFGAIERAVGPGYFRTMGIPIRKGRTFTAGDVVGSPRVAIVNEYLARSLFPHTNPIGQTLEILPHQRAPWLDRPGVVTIVGVAANVKQVGINEVNFDELCLPFAQAPAPSFGVVVHSALNVHGIVAPLRQAIGAVDLDVPITAAATFDQRVADALQADRFNLLVIAAFALVSVLIAAVGIYAALAFAVTERTREFGVRLALGARPGRIVIDALMQAIRLGATGGALGLVGAWALARALGNALYLVPHEHNGLLYGVQATDPVALVSAFLAIIVVAAFAGLVPARRVGRIDPMKALRRQ